MVSRSQANKTPLGCGRTGHSLLGLSVDKLWFKMSNLSNTLLNLCHKYFGWSKEVQPWYQQSVIKWSGYSLHGVKTF